MAAVGRPAAAAQPKGMSVGCIILIVLGALGILVVGVVLVLGYGTRKYITDAKTAEAKNALGQLGKDVVTSYEGLDEDVPSEGRVRRRLCPSASSPVPADRSLVSGRKYQSSATDWERDHATNAGFACLRFNMTMPQYFQYDYHATANTFVITARGDLDGDGIYSTFELRGNIVGDRLHIEPTIFETNPEE